MIMRISRVGFAEETVTDVVAHMLSPGESRLIVEREWMQGGKLQHMTMYVPFEIGVFIDIHEEREPPDLASDIAKRFQAPLPVCGKSHPLLGQVTCCAVGDHEEHYSNVPPMRW